MHCVYRAHGTTTASETLAARTSARVCASDNNLCTNGCCQRERIRHHAPQDDIAILAVPFHLAGAIGRKQDTRECREHGNHSSRGQKAAVVIEVPQNHQHLVTVVKGMTDVVQHNQRLQAIRGCSCACLADKLLHLTKQLSSAGVRHQVDDTVVVEARCQQAYIAHSNI